MIMFCLFANIQIFSDIFFGGEKNAGYIFKSILHESVWDEAYFTMTFFPEPLFILMMLIPFCNDFCCCPCKL